MLVRRSLLAAALSIACTATALASVRASHYRGRTSQRETITFSLSKGHVDGLTFVIDDRCPDGHTLFVSAKGFPPMPISRSGGFGGAFGSASEPTEVHGTIKGKQASGSVRDTSRSRRKGKPLCHGKATFTATRK